MTDRVTDAVYELAGIERRRLEDVPRGWYFRLNADDPRWRLRNTEATWLWDKDAKVLCRPPSGHVEATPDDLLALLEARCSQQTGDWTAAQARLGRHVNDFELIHKARDEIRRLRAADAAPTGA